MGRGRMELNVRGQIFYWLSHLFFLDSSVACGGHVFELCVSSGALSQEALRVADDSRCIVQNGGWYFFSWSSKFCHSSVLNVVWRELAAYLGRIR